MRLIDGMKVFWTDTHHARIGVDPRIGAQLDNFSSQEIMLVAELTRPHTSVEYYEKAKRLKIPRSRAQHIEALLDNAGLLCLESPHIPDAGAYTRWRREPPDYRRRIHVHIVRLDPLGVSIAMLLSSCGIGTITTADDTSVTAIDHPALSSSMIGYPKVHALETALRAMNPIVKLDPDTIPDVAILTGSYGADPHISRVLSSQGIPVFHAWVEEVDIVLGPFTLPHSSACATCINLYKIDSDPAWTAIAPQAFASSPISAPIANEQMAAAIAAREVLSYLDGYPSILHKRLCVIPPHPDVPYLCPVKAHPRCGCIVAQSGSAQSGSVQSSFAQSGSAHSALAESRRPQSSCAQSSPNTRKISGP